MTTTADLHSPVPGSLNLVASGDLRIPADEPVNTVWAYGRLRKLFFLAGHARSGTTWAARVLMRHPRVFMDGEFHFQALRAGFDAMRTDVWHRAKRDPVLSTSLRCYADTVRLCLGACSHQKMDAEWVGDRTPVGLNIHLAGAPYFLIVRDGRDSAVSLAILVIQNQGKALNQFRDDAKLAAVRKHVAADRDFFKKHPHELVSSEAFVRFLARGWGAQAKRDMALVERIRAGEVDARVHMIRYEMLHKDPEGERDKMYRFLDLDPSEAQPLTAESGTRPGLQTDNHQSDKRKGEVGDWANYFTDDAKRWFKEEAGEVMIQLGYERDMKW